MIELDGVGRLHRGPDGTVVALADISFRVAAGERVAVTGPTGSGKSTLLHLLGGMERVSAGAVRVEGRNLERMSRAALAVYRRSVGIVFQGASTLMPALGVLDNVLLPFADRRARAAALPYAQALLADIGLSGRDELPVDQLSAGQRQRVAVARALVTRPRLVLADEPTGGLDRETGDAVLTTLLRVAAEQGAPVLLATHDAGVAVRCDRVLRVRHGRLVDDVRLQAEAPDTTWRRICAPAQA